jgi:amino acid transporter
MYISEHPEISNGTSVFQAPAVDGPRDSWRSRLIGRPLATADMPHQAVRKLVGLAVFASDALSSTAYATQEMLIILAAAGTMALQVVFPISLAIAGLLVILTISYEQTIHAYTGGGGAYIVSRDNLGEAPAKTAAAALLTDYILTVAVSVSSGVAQIVSAFPALYSYRVYIAVGLVMFVMLVNLRGVRESGATFAAPTYLFIGMMFLTIGVAFYRYLAGTLGTVPNPPPSVALGQSLQAVTLFLILHAFSSGTTALTGVEAISNGIPAFREPRSRNAGLTLIAMAAILGVLFLSIGFLVGPIQAVPSEQETVISQLARTAFGGQGPLYLLMISATTLILILAANTSFADFPRLAALAAGDGFLPRQLTYRGSRLVFSWGIVLLGLVACMLIIVFQASVTALIPLYAIGVFLSFTLSQTGMARRWWKSGHLTPGVEVKEPGSVLHYERGWRVKMAINMLGAVCTAIVVLVFAFTKFRDGAWIVVVLMPALVFVFSQIHRHYKKLAGQLSLEKFQPAVPGHRHRVILPIGGVHQGALVALQYARLLSDDVTAVHVASDPAEAERIKQKWDSWGEGTRLVIVESPYRLMVEPLIGYIKKIASQRQRAEMLTIVIPHFVPAKWWHNVLHAQTATMLRFALLAERGVVIIEVPYHVE